MLMRRFQSNCQQGMASRRIEMLRQYSCYMNLGDTLCNQKISFHQANYYMYLLDMLYMY